MPRGRGRGRVGTGGAPAKGRGRGRGKSGQSVGQFLAPRNGRQAGAVANAGANAEYNPEIRELRSQAKGSRQREQDLGSWYAQLAEDYQGATDAGAAALQSIQDTTSKQLGEASGRSSADLAKLSADDEAFAKLTGGPKDTAGLSQIAQAGAAAERSRVALNAPVAQEQANFVGRLGGNKTAARMQGIEERRSEQRRRDKIRADLTGVRKEKGAARVTRKEEIRQADRGYSTDLKQLKLSQREARAAEQQAAADAALARIEAARDARQDAIGNRMEQERIGISGKNAATSARSQRASARDDRQDNRLAAQEKGSEKRDPLVTAKSLVRQRGKPIRKATEWAELEEAVRKEGASPTEARQAIDKLRKMQAQKSRGGYDRRVRKGEVAGPPTPRGR